MGGDRAAPRLHLAPVSAHPQPGWVLDRPGGPGQAVTPGNRAEAGWESLAAAVETSSTAVLFGGLGSDECATPGTACLPTSGGHTQRRPWMLPAKVLRKRLGGAHVGL